MSRAPLKPRDEPMTPEQRAGLKLVVTKALIAADYLPGGLADKADRISNDIVDSVDELIASVAGEATPGDAVQVPGSGPFPDPLAILAALTPEMIRARLDQLDGEAEALRTLLRSISRRQRAATRPPRKPTPRDDKKA